nr:C-type lectin domain containing protein [Haemonchus contortus]
MLKNLASKNYNLVNYEKGKQLYAQELRQLLCEANCFCKKRWVPYNNDQWNAPQGGCYYPLMIPSIQMLANRTCYRKNDGVLAVDEDSKKDAFLMNLVPQKTKIWLGLKFKGNQWLWPDGSSIGRFTKWAKGHPNTSKGDCVYMQQYSDSKSAWFSDDCYNDHYYICQTKPCDSSKYCAPGLGNDDSDI